MPGLELARSLDFSGPGLSVFFETKPKLRFSLFRSYSSLKNPKFIHVIYSLDIWVRGKCIFLVKLLAQQHQQLYLMPYVRNLYKMSNFQL